jgi:hypothetical protein
VLDEIYINGKCRRGLLVSMFDREAGVRLIAADGDGSS